MTGGHNLKKYTDKAKKAIDLAVRISKKLGCNYVEQSMYSQAFLKREPELLRRF